METAQKLLTIEATSNSQPDLLTGMNVQVHIIPSNIKHNGTECFGATEDEIPSKLPLLLNNLELGTKGEGEKKTNTFHHLSILTWYGTFLTLGIWLFVVSCHLFFPLKIIWLRISDLFHTGMSEVSY